MWAILFLVNMLNMRKFLSVGLLQGCDRLEKWSGVAIGREALAFVGSDLLLYVKY